MALGSLLALTRPKTGSPYSIGSVAPHMLNAVMQEQTKAELTAESRSYLPDYETLSKAIIDRDLFAGDKKKYVSGLNSLTRRFMSDYKKDPYYAFSTEARSQIRKMQDIASDPLLDAMEQAKKTSDAEFERARKDDMDFNPVIQDGRALVNRKGRVQWIPLSQLQEGDTPMNFTDQYNSTMMGGTNGQPIQYDMSDWKTVLDKVTTAATNLGTEGFDTQFGNGLMSRTKSQLEAAKARMDWLKQNGFTQADINAIQSEYIKRNGVTDNVLAKSLNWAAKLGDQYIQSSADFSAGIAVDPALDAAKKRAETVNLTANMGPRERMFAIGKENPQAYMMQQGDDPASLHIGSKVDKSIWLTGQNIKDSATDQGYMPLEYNPMFQEMLANPHEPLRTADGVEIDPSLAIPDPAYDPRRFYRDGKWYMAVPVLYATDELSNSAFEDSKYVGMRDPSTGHFTKKAVGDVGGNSNTSERYYTNVRNAIDKNDDLYPEHLLGAGESDLFEGNDDLYQAEVIVELRDDVEVRMRELDGNPHYSVKQAHSFIEDIPGTQQPLIKFE